MPSLMEMVLRTMPFSALHTLAGLRGKKIEELHASEVREMVRLLPEKEGFYVELPEVIPGLPPEEQPLWAFSYNTARPAEVGSVYCRVRDADYVGHHVADRVAWGIEEPDGSFKEEVRVVFQAGADVRLPLTADYLLWAFRVNGGRIEKGEYLLWPLEANLDTSVVAVFLYDIDSQTGEVLKTDLDEILDPVLRDQVRDELRAVQELGTVAEGAARVEDESGGSPAPVPWNEAWGSIVLRAADFWPEHPEQPNGGGAAGPAGTGGVVGQTVSVQTEPARVMVVFSFTTGCERADFEPGGVVGFARCHPHLLVSATVPIKSIEGSAHIDRPQKMSKWHEEGRDMKASCCKPPHDGWTEEIGALLVTDANENPHIVSPVPLPFWSNMFYYYIVDPYFREAGRKYHVVRTDRPDRRDSGVPLVRREIAWVVSDPEENEGPAFEEAAQQAGIVRKEPRQGMFDNVHLAPRLRLMNVKEVGDTTPKHLIQPRYPIEDRAEWHLDDIVMAPFCAHDCLHMHWRWSAIADKPWSLGWDATGPHRAAGAPMVPLGHDVWLRFRRRNAITYHVLTTNAQPTLDWHVLLHHGFGFAVAISDKSNFGMAMFAIDGAAHVYFIKEGQPWLFANESTSAYYWMARFAYRIVDDKAVPRERLSFPSADLLQQAIDL